MKKDGLIEQIDSMIPKAGPHVKLSVGQSVVIMILRTLSSEIPNGLCNVALWAKVLPVNYSPPKEVGVFLEILR